MTDDQITVTREGRYFVARAGDRIPVRAHDDVTDDALDFQVRSGQAILVHRHAAAKQAQEREAGINALVEEAGFLTNWAARQTCVALYDKGHRATPVPPAEVRPFQVGDLVKISDDATTKVSDVVEVASLGRGKRGRVVAPENSDAEVIVRDLDGVTVYMPGARFLTLATPASDLTSLGAREAQS